VDDMSIHVVFGLLGSHKTLYSIVCAYALQQWDSNYSIKANFSLADEMNATLVQNYDDILNSYNCILLLDEAQVFANSRNSNSKENKALANMGLISRKQNLEVFFILPRLASLDINIRDITDFYHYMVLEGTTIIHIVCQNNMLTEELDVINEQIYNVEDFRPFYKMFDTREKPYNFMLNANLT